MKKWKAFKIHRRAHYSLWMLAGLLFFSLTAEFWINDRPHLLYYKGQMYFPSVKNYSAQIFNQEEQLFLVNYKKLKLQEGDFAFWPLIRWSPFESNSEVSAYPSPPSSSNWMGTDNRGRDVLARVIYGFRYSLGFSLLVWLGSFFIGSLLGSVMGFLGGRVDLWGQRCVEVFQSIPFFLVLITIVVILGSSLWALALYSAFFGWMNISLYMRSEFLKIRNMEFIQLARSFGAGPWRIIIKHIFPNALTPLVTFSPFKLAQGVYSLAILDYLGFGLKPPTPSLGELLLQAEQYFTIAWWLALFPSLFLFLTLLSLNFIGEGVRAVFDPKALPS